MSFNPNELVLERVRSVEEYDIATNELIGRYTQIEDPSLQFSAEGTDVTDAMGSTIMTFYNAQSGTFSFTNSLFSLDLAASQFGSVKKLAGAGDDAITVPVTEMLTIDATTHTVTLKYAASGTAGDEIGFAKVVNADNTFGATYKQGAAAGEGVFTYDAESKKLTFPEGATGRVFVKYDRVATEKAVQVDKRTDSEPQVKSLLIHAIFHDPCNKNIVYAGSIWCPRAQIDPSSVEIGLTSDGKHAASYLLQKEYCAEEAKLCSIFVVDETESDEPVPPTPGVAKLSTLAITGVELTPAFDADTVAYTGATTDATNVITATGADGATVAITVGDTPVESGSAATWAEGDNTVTIVVSKTGATSTTYTVVVTKS